eukprot:2561089-Rhodomonas_salina.1
MPDTEIASGGIGLRRCYAMSGTDLAHGHTRPATRAVVVRAREQEQLHAVTKEQEQLQAVTKELQEVMAELERERQAGRE